MRIVKAIGFIIPILETLAGILMLTRWRKIGFYIVIATHLFVLAYIGPWGISYNSAIWPWNILMLSYALIFIHTRTTLGLRGFISYAFWVSVLFILPCLNFANLYYPYFSFDLYSGPKYYAYVVYKESSSDTLLKHSRLVRNKTYFEIDLNQWSFDNLSTPTTHSRYLFSRISKSIEAVYNPVGMKTEISKYPYRERELLRIYK